jgi:hypothetical protein
MRTVRNQVIKIIAASANQVIEINAYKTKLTALFLCVLLLLLLR